MGAQRQIPGIKGCHHTGVANCFCADGGEPHRGSRRSAGWAIFVALGRLSWHRGGLGLGLDQWFKIGIDIMAFGLFWGTLWHF